MDAAVAAANDAQINDSEAKQRYGEKYYALRQQNHFFGTSMAIFGKEKIQNARRGLRFIENALFPSYLKAE